MKTSDPPSMFAQLAKQLRSFSIPFAPVRTSPVFPVFGCTIYFGPPINDPTFEETPTRA